MLKIIGNKGWPDRLLISPQGRMVFIEFKRMGQRPRPLQEYMLERLTNMGVHAVWIDDYTTFHQLMKALASAPQSGSPTSTKKRELTDSVTRRPLSSSRPALVKPPARSKPSDD